MSEKTNLRLGTRASALARWQADWVRGQLEQEGISVETILIATQGDVRTGSIASLGAQGVFTKEIQKALLEDRIDLAVHSLKDLPTDVISGLRLAATPPRESPGDVLVSNMVDDFESLSPQSRVGTGSTRRRAQLLHQRDDLEIVSIRGNVDTRLRLVDEGSFDAIVLAEAGLRRLGLSHRISQILPRSWMLPAVGQGALGLEIREGDHRTRELIQGLDDPNTHQAVLAERALLRTLQGGCLAPVGAFAQVLDGALCMDAVVLDPDGVRKLATKISGPPEESEALGRQAAEHLLDNGAGELIAASRHG